MTTFSRKVRFALVCTALAVLALSPGAVSAQPSCDSGDASLVGYWTFDEGVGTSAADGSGLGNDGSLLNGAGWTSGRTGDAGDFALALDGVNDYVNAGSDASLASLATLTYAAWVYPTADGDREIFSKRNSTHELRLKGAGPALVLRGCIIASGGNACSDSMPGVVPLGAWTHVAMTYDHSGDRQVHLYVDGVEVSYAAQSTAGGTLAGDASASQLLGRRQDNSRAFAGFLDEMRIYNTVLDLCRLGELAETGCTDCDNDGLPNGDDPCPNDARNLCFGPVAVDTFDADIRINTNVSGAECSLLKVDCTGTMWYPDFGFNQPPEASTCNLGGGGEGCVISGIGAIFGCEDAVESPDPTLGDGDTEDIFQCDHWDLAGGDELVYDFAVAPGTYLVNLLFANTDLSTATEGSRVFDIQIQGDLVYDDFDQVAAAGGSGVAVVRSAVVTVAGGEDLQIAFLHGVGDPAVKGIEVLVERCSVNADCDDGVFCNGAEFCDAELNCQAGTPPDCDDGVSCTIDSCNETTDSCDNTPDDGLCDGGEFCTGVETCDPVLDCVVGTPPDCDDGVTCTIDSCNETTDSCDNVPDDGLCDDGLFCTGAETCDPALDCVVTVVACSDGVACTVDTCNEATDTCVFTSDDGLCDDGDLCTGVQICDPVLDCQGGTPVTCGPGEICEPLTGLCGSCDSLTASEDVKLTASDGVAGENFGFTAAISGTTAVVGERFGNAAYVFEFNGSVWSQQAILTKSDGGTTDEFGFDVTISGDTIAVGAPFHNAVVPDDGAVYVFVKPAGGWVDMTETYKITHSSPETKDQLGWSVSLSGNTLLAGATGRFAPTPGAAYVFEFDGLNWIQKAELTASDGANGDEFGISVEASPATLVVGAHQNDVNGSNSGSAYVFEKPVGGWIDMNQTAILSPSDPGNNDFYGQAVDISGDTIVVAARKDNDGGFDTGSVYAFDKPAGGWVDMNQTQKLTASDAQAGDEFGRAPAILGDTLVVGAPKAAAAAGSAYVFERNGGTWTEAGKLMPSDGAAGEEYGFVTALSQVSIVVGARFGDSVYAFNEELVAHWTFDEGVGSIATDASVFGNDGSLVSGAGWTSGHTGDGGDFAVALDGVDDHVNAGSDQSLDTLAALTYSAWVYPTATGDREILSKANSTHEFRLAGTGTLRGCIIASGPNSCSDSVSGAVPLNTWTHVAMTYDHSGDRQVHLYIDGLEVSYAGQSTAGGTLASDAALPQLLGRRQSGNDRRPFAGALDEMQIYNEALPSCRIEELADPGGCLIDADCDDGLSCNGAETCNVGTGACEAGTPTVCDDGTFCNGVETCNESTDSCDPGTPPACDDGAFCNGAETCNEGTDSCDPGTPPVCDDGAFCNGLETCNEGTDNCDPGSAPCDPGLETCNEGSDICEPIGCTLDSECDDTLFCNGFETCFEGGCNAGAPPDCDDSLFCNGTETCNEATDGCDAGTPPACDDGLFCNGVETCNEGTDSCDPGTTVDCSDAIGCTVDTCNEGTDSCDRIATDSLCADGDLCNGVETCDALLDCQAGTAIICDEGLVCEPATGICGSACASGDVALVGHWTFDEGTGPVASDSSGLGNDGGLKNGAGWAGGHTGGGGDFAVALDGVNDHVDAGSGSSLDNLAALTYSAWVLPTATGDREIFSKANSTHELRLKGSGTLRGCIVASGPDACSESASGAVPLNTWTHVAMTYDHSGDRQVHLYVDGVEVSYAAQSTAGGTLAGDASASQLLGRRQNNTRAFAGFLDEMRIYNAVLDPCRLEQLAGSPVCVIDADCDNELFCDGAETCNEGVCEAGIAPDCDDFVDCTVDSCDEDADSCEYLPNNTFCDSGLACVNDFCDPVLGCVADPVPAGTTCDLDADLCTVDECGGSGLCANVGDVTCGPGATCDPGTGSCEGAPDQPTNVEPTDEATGVSTSPTLTVNVTDPDDDSLDVTFFGRGAGTGETFTIVVLPDTQNYADHNQSNQAIFSAQTQWIVDNKDALNIAFVTQVGDCVQYGSAFPSEWVTADAAFSLLEDPVTTMLPAGLPYGIAVGNHDQSPIGTARIGVDEGATTTEYNATFGVSRFQSRGYYGGHYDFGNPALYTNNNDNHYQFFSAGGMDFIVIHLEYDLVDGPTRAAVLAWADNLLTTHSDKRAIVVSHYITGIHPGYIAPVPDLQSFGPQGQATYDALKHNPNLFLTLSGHVSGVGRRVDTFGGNVVHSVLQNYQLEPSGGNGWLRIFEFVPADDEIRVSTYSPWLDQPWVVNGAEPWRALSENEFTLPYEMSGFEVIGSVSGIPSGDNASLTWPALTPASEHEWFVEVSDGTSTTTGPVWTFTTGCALDAECDDGNACTDDACNLATGACEYADNNDPCDDADFCTETDICSGGVCGGTPIAGCCVSDADCDDVNSCSLDQCVDNICSNTAIPNCCELDIDCDDGDPCTTDSCGGSAALSFDGVDDHVDFGNDAWISDFGTGSLTVEGWFKANSVDEDFKGLFHVGRRGDYSQLAVYLLTGAQLAAAVEDTALGKVDSPGVGFTLGEWNHFAAVVDRTTNQLRVYLNGGSPVIGTLPAGFGSIDGASDNTVLGALRLSSGVLDTFLDGGIDEVRIWDHARTQTQIQDNMNLQINVAPGLIERWGLNEGSGGTTSASVLSPTNDGTINGATWIGSGPVDLGSQCTFTPIPGCGGFECTVDADCDDTNACTLDECLGDNTCSSTPIPDCCTVDADCDDVDACTTDACGNPVAVSFDGTDDSVEFSNDLSISDFGTNDRTVEGWFKPGAQVAGFPGIFHLGRRGANPQVAVYLSTSGQLVVGVEDDATHAVDVPEPTTLIAGQWYHFAAVIDRGTNQLRLYLDGGTPVTGSIASLSGPIAGVGDAVALGALRDSAGVLDTFFVGSIDEVRIWDHARTQTEIQDNMNLQIDSAAGLIERWGLNEGSGGTTSASVSSPTNDGTINGATWIGSDLVDLGNQCTFTPIPGCGFECTVDADCDDTNACTLDECLGDNTCSNTAIPDCCTLDADCDDTNACTLDECLGDNTCSNTAIPDCCTVDADCNDVDTCTTDACGNPVALSFDGTDDSVEFSNDLSISDFGTSDRTVEGWFRPDTVGAGFPGIFHLGRKGTNPQVAVFLFNGDLAVGVEDNAGLKLDLVDPTTLFAGQWYHFAAVIDRGTNQLRLYRDGGTPVTGSIASLSGNPIAGVGDAVALGALRDSAGVLDTFFVGSIDEVRIWDHARTQTEIQDNMNLQIDSAAGLIERWGLNEGSGGTTSASVSSPTNDGTINGATWIGSDLVDLGNQCTFTPIPGCGFECTVDADCDDTNACTLDECLGDNTCSNTAIPDCCTVDADCNDVDTCTTDACGNPVALSFDGTDDSVEFSNDLSISDFGTSDRTVEGWFRPDTVGAGFPGIFHLGRKGTNPQVAVFLFNGDLAVGVEDNAGLKLDLVDPTTLFAGQWYHFAAVIDRGTNQLRLYRDGGTPVTGSIASLSGNPIAGVGDAVGIGALRSSAGVFDTFFEGSIDEVRIWDHARTQTQIQDNMNLQIDTAPGLIERWGLNEGSGATTSASVSSPTNDGTLNGAAWIGSDLVDLGSECTFTPVPGCTP